MGIPDDTIITYWYNLSSLFGNFLGCYHKSNENTNLGDMFGGFLFAVIFSAV